MPKHERLLDMHRVQHTHPPDSSHTPERPIVIPRHDLNLRPERLSP